MFGFKKKKLPPQAVNSSGQPLDKLIDGELPFGWVYKYQSYYKPKDNEMVSIAVQIRSTKNLNEKISLLQNLIDYFYSYKKECEIKGECFQKYFDLNWMHCHNSKSDDFVYIQPYEDELNKLKIKMIKGE